MRKNFFFSNDGLMFIDMSQVSAITQKNTSSVFYVHFRSCESVVTVDSDTVTELFDAMHAYSYEKS